MGVYLSGMMADFQPMLLLLKHSRCFRWCVWNMHATTPGDTLRWARSSPLRTQPRLPRSIASFLKLRQPPSRDPFVNVQIAEEGTLHFMPEAGCHLCRNHMLGGPVQPRFTSHAVTIADAALIASLTSCKVAVG